MSSLLPACVDLVNVQGILFNLHRYTVHILLPMSRDILSCSLFNTDKTKFLNGYPKHCDNKSKAEDINPNVNNENSF